MQKLLYLIMVLLGVYILGKGSAFFFGRPVVQQAVARQGMQRRLEDMVMRTLMPGYTAAVEGWTMNGMAWLLEPIVPVYGYLASLAPQEAEEAGTDTLPETGQEETGRGNIRSWKIKENAEIWSDRKLHEPPLPQETTPERTDGEEQKPMQGEADTVNTDRMEKSENVSENITESMEPFNGESGKDTEGKEVTSTAVSPDLLQQLSDYDYLLNQYFTVDAGTMADAELLDASKLLTEDLSIRKNPQVPQILIYHTHSQEEFADSVPGDTGTSIVGMGAVLAEALRGYGYQVIHDTGVYDLIDGVLDRSAAYDYARVAVEEILQKYPTIEVVIDLHRDGVDGQKFVTEIDGKPTSMIMFFNGISRNSQDEPLTYLANPYTQQNLAFSLQLELAAREKYPGYTRNIYLKAERFNLHLRPRSLLVEAGTQLNTVEEERNAMQPLAELLNGVLEGQCSN